MWFNNKGGTTFFGTGLRLITAANAVIGESEPFTSHAHSINGMERRGVPNNCYHGMVNVGGNGWYRTRLAACV